MNEPKTAILRPVRTEYGKEIRKDYEAGNVTEKWGNIRQLEARPDEISNTLTTVLKDNLLLEVGDAETHLDGAIVDCKNSFGNPKVFTENVHPTILSTHYKEPTLLRQATPCISSAQAHATVNDNLSPALTAAAGMGGGQAAMVFDPPTIEVMGELNQTGHEQGKRVHDPEGISPTATAVAGGTHHIKIFDYSRYRVRKLTPTEYGRLQGFPMERWVQVVSNTQAYKQFGNAVTTTVARAIGTSIADFLNTALGGATQ